MTIIDRTLLRDLADDHLAHDLEIAEEYLTLATEAYRLRNRIADMKAAKAGSAEWIWLENVEHQTSSCSFTAIRRFDELAATMDHSPRIYGSGGLFTSLAAMLRDGQKRIESLKRGRKYRIAPPMHAHAAGFIAPDDLRPV